MKSTYSIPFDITAPQAVWKAMVIDMPMTMAATSLRFAAQRLQAQIIYNSPLKAPIKKGDVIAKLRVTTASQSVNEVPLHAAEDVPQAGAMRRGLDTLVHMAFGWVLR